LLDKQSEKHSNSEECVILVPYRSKDEGNENQFAGSTEEM